MKENYRRRGESIQYFLESVENISWANIESWFWNEEIVLINWTNFWKNMHPWVTQLSSWCQIEFSISIEIIHWVDWPSPIKNKQLLDELEMYLLLWSKSDLKIKTQKKLGEREREIAWKLLEDWLYIANKNVFGLTVGTRNTQHRDITWETQGGLIQLLRSMHRRS